jgi:outer membrane protein TolC
VSLTFGVTDYFQLGARRLAEEGAERAERARSDEIYLALRMQSARVRTVFETARKIAENTPVQLKAANDALTRARARYDSGLGTLTEVADAQRLVAQAEIDDLLARLSIWRTLAAAARVQGDLEPFLQLVAVAQREKK